MKDFLTLLIIMYAMGFTTGYFFRKLFFLTSIKQRSQNERHML